MRRRRIETIESWFAEHDGDGEFSRSDRRKPYSVIWPASGRCRLIYTTKPATVAEAIYRDGESDRFSMIGRFGLPSQSDLTAIQRIVGRRRLFFLGDADPVDLLVYCWMRDIFGSKKISHIGVNDRLLSALSAPVRPMLATSLSKSESRSLPVLRKTFPDYQQVVGAECARLIDEGQRIELESLGSFRLSSAGIFRST